MPDRPVALVTGATRGIGRAIAQDLARTHHVLVGGRSRHAVDAVVAALPSAEPFVADLAAGELPPLPDRLDVLVHNAGVAERGRIEQTDRTAWQRMLLVNVVAVADLTRAALPALRRARGLVVAINSGAGFVSGPNNGAYAASKFALRALTDALREEERGNGVRVTSVHPGLTDSDMQRALTAGEGRDYDLDLLITPEDVAAVVRLAVDLPERGTLEVASVRPTRRR